MRSADPRALDIGVGAMLAGAEGGAPDALARHEILDRFRDEEKRGAGAPRQLFAAACAPQYARKSLRPPKSFRAAVRPRLRKTVAKRAADQPAVAQRPVDAAA